MSRISGPLLDRIDLHIEVPALSYDDLESNHASSLNSCEMRKEVQHARKVQLERLKVIGKQHNSQMTSQEIRHHCRLNLLCRKLLRQAVETLGLSARAHDKILRVARTIADLESRNEIEEHHIAEAVGYRSVERFESS